eukprot:GHRR01023001.1.p1 GENE.GHRR01023001.1~~GHRR01023001.1.p1  ORF type:complete len:136 (+),score=35.45 GHRR01023001.1:108-515(+)
MPNPPDADRTVSIKPYHVLLLGAGILGSGIFLTASLTYKQAGKQLVVEGIDASIRRRILPHAAKALTGSLVLTGVAATGGFYMLESLGFVSREAPTSISTLHTAMDMLRPPSKHHHQQAPGRQTHGMQAGDTGDN